MRETNSDEMEMERSIARGHFRSHNANAMMRWQHWGKFSKSRSISDDSDMIGTD